MNKTTKAERVLGRMIDEVDDAILICKQLPPDNEDCKEFAASAVARLKHIKSVLQGIQIANKKRVR